MAENQVIYYTDSQGKSPVKSFLDSLSDRQKAKIFRIFMHIEEYGLSSIVPHIKKLKGNPLWEIRILGKDNIRILYATLDKGGIIILHGFIKKSFKTPLKEISNALERYDQFKLDL
jgi:phage-related protein